MLTMARLAWLPSGSVVHLALPVGHREYDSCSRVVRWPMRSAMVLDVDTQQLIPQHTSRDGWAGRPLDSTWLGDRDRAPERPLCSTCAASWENRVAWINSELAQLG